MFSNLHYRIVIFMLIAQLILFLPLCAGDDVKAGKKNGKDIFPDIPRATSNDGATMPVLAVSPREIDFGSIGPDDIVNSLLSLKNIRGGTLQWFISGPEGWNRAEHQDLSGVLATDHDVLCLSVKSVRTELPQNIDKSGRKFHSIQLTFEAGGNVLVMTRDLIAGAYREPLKISSNGGIQTVLLNFRVMDVKSSPQLDVEPLSVDFGVAVPGKQISRQIRLTNKGRETVRWHVTIPKPGDERLNIPPLKGRYISFFNDEIKESGIYVPMGHLKDVLEVSGKWMEYEGYPSSHDAGNFLRLRFSGTGIGVYFWRGPDGGQVAAYIDDQLVYVYNGNASELGREELPLTEGLPDGQHVLTLVNGDGRAIIEGVGVYGRELMKGTPGWISVVPDSGTTSREIDYVNIRMDTHQLTPGFYGEQILLSSNRGDIVLEAFVEIRHDSIPRFLDVYRYVRNYNYLYTTNPQAEAARIQSGKYVKEGIAFRLFAPGTPGTTEFNRWYNMKKDDHYYCYTTNGGGKSFKNYVLEGSIGNIATSRLTNTRELYRWYNPETGRHFYTTDQKGEGITRKGYKFDGIAGYVR